jgi:hypothetical protein
LVHGDEGDDDKPAMWVSDDPAPAGLWPVLRAEHPRSGLWPLLLDTLSSDPRRPWDDGELWPASMSHPGDHDPDGCWRQGAAYTATGDDDDVLPPADRVAVTAPYGQRWPGLADPGEVRMDPDEHADRCAEDLLRSRPGLRLGLVAVDRGGAALSVAGWQGAVNYINDTARLSAVLQAWEDRFGARVIAAGFAELYVAVAAPPSDHVHALPVAAEHFAFCPDNIWQGTSPLTRYAQDLVGAPVWRFWWTDRRRRTPRTAPSGSDTCLGGEGPVLVTGHGDLDRADVGQHGLGPAAVAVVRAGLGLRRRLRRNRGGR